MKQQKRRDINGEEQLTEKLNRLCHLGTLWAYSNWHKNMSPSVLLIYLPSWGKHWNCAQIIYDVLLLYKRFFFWFFILTTSILELHTRSGTSFPKCEGNRHRHTQNVSEYGTLLDLLDSHVCDFFPIVSCDNPCLSFWKGGWRKFHLLMYLISSSAEKLQIPSRKGKHSHCTAGRDRLNKL